MKFHLSARQKGQVCTAFKVADVSCSKFAYAVVLFGVSSMACAQNYGTLQTLGVQSAGRQTLLIVPRVTITETLTDNANLSSNSKQAELVSEASPGIRISSDFGRIKGYLDYSLNARLSSQGVSNFALQNALTTFGSLEAVDNFAFFDFSASIAQQTVSSFGAISPGNNPNNGNQTESSNYRLSPHVRGNFGGIAEYQARYSLSVNRNRSAAASDVTAQDLQLSLSGRAPASRLGWSIQGGRQSSNYSLGRAVESDSITGSLNYVLNPQLRLSASAGQEGNNYNTLTKETFFTSGQGIQWTPSPNASFSASRQTRSFGQSHNINLSYRTARTAWTFSDSQDVTNTPSQSGLGSRGAIFDLYFAQFASIEPDPVKRAVLVSSFLQAFGINPNTVVVSNFLTSALALQRRQDISFSLLGLRDTITFTATKTDTSRLDSLSTAVDDLSNGGGVRQIGLSVSYAHRLTPETSMNLTGLNQHSTDSKGLQESRLNSISLGINTRLGLKSSAAVNARRVISDSGTAPYNETAISGTVNVQF
jgi:uncharacterized protein (PEP-CTERM system associated)